MNKFATAKFVNMLDFFPPDAGDGMQPWSASVCQFRYRTAGTDCDEESHPLSRDEVARLILDVNERHCAVRALSDDPYSDLLVSASKQLHTQNQLGVRVHPYTSAQVEDAMFKAVDQLQRLSDIGCFTWAAIEGYPTPDVDVAADNLHQLLTELEFVDELVFSRSHDRACIAYSIDHPDFYERIERELLEWCRARNIGLHFEREMESQSRTPIRVSDLVEPH